MKTTPLIIVGSARNESDTKHYVKNVFEQFDYQLIDLLDYSIAPYDYSKNYPSEDAFNRLIDLVLEHSIVVFATPVYWYSMSGSMKIFFDRLSDLVTNLKEKGRKLKGKHIFLFSVGASAELPEGFEVPFRETAHYLDMLYEGCVYFSTETPENELISTNKKQDFIAKFAKVL